MRVTLLLLLFVVSALGRSVDSPCELEPEVKEASRSWDQMDDAVVPYRERYERRLKLVQGLLKKYPHDIQVHQWRQQLLSGPVSETREVVVEEYRRLYAANPDDPVYQFLYASVITGRNSPEAITILEKLVHNVPAFAPAHRTLAQIYQYPAFKDTAKAVEHLEVFQSICPDSSVGIAAGRRLSDPAFVERSVSRLRRLVKDTDDLQRYSLLWAFEFRARPASLHDKVREKVKQDVERLRALGLNERIDWYRTLEAGYELLGDDTGQRWVGEQIQERFPQSSRAVWRAERSFLKAHPFPRFADAKEQEEHGRALFAETERLIERWPNEPSVWSMRLVALLAFRQPPKETVETTADRLLETYEAQPDSFRSVPPVAYQIAELYLKANVRVEQVPRLVEMGNQELLAGEKRHRSDYAKPEQRHGERLLVIRFLEGRPLTIDSYLRRRMFSEARQVLHDMESRLQESQPAPDATDQAKKGFTHKQSLLWEMRSRLAEAEGRKPDAAVCYLTAAHFNPEPSRPRVIRVNAAERACVLWKEMGGTLEGLQAFNEQISSSTKGEEPSATRWQKSEKPLPEFEITDTQGRLWRLADIKGKKTLVNLWARWCGWCLPELPVVQEMHEQLRDREDVQVITLNLDENPGVIEPFMTENAYSFPVLPATALVDKLIPLLGIPRNWIVDSRGHIVYEQHGFDLNQPPEQWLHKKSIELMEALE